jgi:hypothetical protein
MKGILVIKDAELFIECNPAAYRKSFYKVVDFRFIKICYNSFLMAFSLQQKFNNNRRFSDIFYRTVRTRCIFAVRILGQATS